MSTSENQPLEFCRSILGEGIRTLFVMPGAQHYQFSTDEEMVAKAAELDAEGKTVYHGCATYAAPQITGPDGKVSFRVKGNVREVKAAWLDIDVGMDKAAKGQGYATQKEAAQALNAFIKANSLPMPTLVLSSGHGVHAYWAFEEAVDRATWEPTTMSLDALCKAANFLADPSRTKDAASVLRLPGTTNRKDPANPKPVTIKHKGKPVRLEAFDAAVCAALTRLGEGKPHEMQEGPEGIGAPPAWAKASGSTGSIVEAAPQRRQHTIEEVEEVLAFIDPNCDRKTWIDVLGALAHEFGESARDLGRRWSAGLLQKPEGGAA